MRKSTGLYRYYTASVKLWIGLPAGTLMIDKEDTKRYYGIPLASTPVLYSCTESGDSNVLGFTTKFTGRQ